MQYLVVIERGPTSYGAYVPHLPGCVAVGATRGEVETLIQEAIAFRVGRPFEHAWSHIEGMREDGLPIPEPHSEAQLVSVVA